MKNFNLIPFTKTDFNNTIRDKINKSLQKENTELRNQLNFLSKDFEKFKEKMAAKVKEATRTDVAREAPSVQDVQYLSDGYDESHKSIKEFEKLETRLNTIESRFSSIAKEIDDIVMYSYQYNLKITGIPQASERETSEETANICLKLFACSGVDISISDIDIAHRVQSRNSRRGQRNQPIICKFVRRMTRDKVVKARKNANGLNANDLGLLSSVKIGRIPILYHLTPRLQELLHLAKIHQTNYNYKYCWAKESTIFLRKTDIARVIRLSSKDDQDSLKLRDLYSSPATI